MKYLCFFFFLLCIDIPVIAQADSPGSPKGSPASDLKIRIRCHATVADPGKHPLIIVDGNPAEINTVKGLNPDNIESIEVIKGSDGQALYGVKGDNGVILIRTKNRNESLLRIEDADDGSPVPGATLTFVPLETGRHSVRLVADAFGQVKSCPFKPGEKYSLAITSVGYTAFYSSFTFPEERTPLIYSLKKEIKENEEVVVISHSTIRCRSVIFCRSEVSKCNSDLIDTVRASAQYIRSADDVTLKLFPNPVSRGSSIKVEMDGLSGSSSIYLRILSLSGATLNILPCKPIKGINRIEIPVAGHWAAGIYFIQVTSEKGKLLKQNKLIIQ